MPTENSQLVFLKEQINERLKKTNSSRIYYRKRSFRFYMLTSVLTAITTIILGLNLKNVFYNDATRITALIITTIVTLLNVYNAFFNHKELWVAYNNATNKFHQLQFEIEFEEKSGNEMNETKIELFRKSYQNIIDELNSTWDKNRLPKSGQS